VIEPAEQQKDVPDMVEIGNDSQPGEAQRTEQERAARAKLYAQPRTPKPRVWPMFLLAFAVMVADQCLKWWIRFNLEPGDTLALWPGVAHWSHVWNRGAAWGVFDGSRWLLVIASSAVCCGLVFFCRHIGASGTTALISAGLILGGAVGNLIDRVKFGYVTDMIDMDTPLGFIREFPVFNVADSALTLGVILLFLMSFQRETSVQRAPK